MQTATKTFDKIKDKLTPRQRVVLIYATGYDQSYSRSIEEIAQSFGNNKEYILEILNKTLEKFPTEVSTILNLEKAYQLQLNIELKQN